MHAPRGQPRPEPALALVAAPLLLQLSGPSPGLRSRPVLRSRGFCGLRATIIAIVVGPGADRASRLDRQRPPAGADLGPPPITPPHRPPIVHFKQGHSTQVCSRCERGDRR